MWKIEKICSFHAIWKAEIEIQMKNLRKYILYKMIYRYSVTSRTTCWLLIQEKSEFVEAMSEENREIFEKKFQHSSPYIF